MSTSEFDVFAQTNKTDIGITQDNQLTSCFSNGTDEKPLPLIYTVIKASFLTDIMFVKASISGLKSCKEMVYAPPPGGLDNSTCHHVTRCHHLKMDDALSCLYACSCPLSQCQFHVADFDDPDMTTWGLCEVEVF